MLRSIEELLGYTLAAEDGTLGRCKDFLFDELTWVVRYMVASTGRWLSGRQVLISPVLLDEPQWKGKLFPVRLTMEQVRASPDLSEHQPVSRQYEEKYYDYYRFPYYWTGPDTWGGQPTPQLLGATREREPIQRVTASVPPEDICLRSCAEMKGYKFYANDVNVGRVIDFFLDDVVWKIRYLSIGFNSSAGGEKQVLVFPDWVAKVSASETRIDAEVEPDSVIESPGYDPSQPINRAIEQRLHDFHCRVYG